MTDELAPKTDDGLCAPFAIETTPWRDYAEGERFALRWRPIGRFGGAQQVGVEICELAPGKQSWPTHYHMLEEEQIWVLAGAATLLLGDKTHEMKAGDYVCFPAGQKAGHAMVNRGAEVCRYLVVGSTTEKEVVVYTESHKVGVRLLGERYPMAKTMEYWEDEGAEGKP
jgi:uncharacterized cupin superfamily protein